MARVCVQVCMLFTHWQLKHLKECNCATQKACGSPCDSPDSHLIYSYPNFYLLWAGLVCLTAILFNLLSQQVCAGWYLTSYIGWPQCTTASHSTVAPLSKSKSAVGTLSPERYSGYKHLPPLLLSPESVINFLLKKKKRAESELEHETT